MVQFEIVLHFLIEAENEKEAKKEFVQAFGLSIIDNCDDFEIFEGAE